MGRETELPIRKCVATIELNPWHHVSIQSSTPGPRSSIRDNKTRTTCDPMVPPRTIVLASASLRHLTKLNVLLISSTLASYYFLAYKCMVIVIFLWTHHIHFVVMYQVSRPSQTNEKRHIHLKCPSFPKFGMNLACGLITSSSRMSGFHMRR